MVLLNIFDNHPILTIFLFVILVGGGIAIFGNKIGIRGFKDGSKVRWLDVATVFITFLAFVALVVLLGNDGR